MVCPIRLAGYLEGAHPDNMARLRITNNGLFDNHVEFVLKSKEAPPDDGVGKGKGASAKKPASATKGGKPSKEAKGRAAGLTLDGVFALNPTSIDIKIDETIELNV